MTTTPDIAQLARDMQRIVDAVEGKPECPFSPDEIERIRRAADFVEWLDMSGRVGKWVLGLLAGVVLILSQWERIKPLFEVPK